MHGYPAVWGCDVDIMSASCRRLLKYNFYEMIHRKEREGRKANPIESFAVFATFAVYQIMKTSPHLFFGSPAAPTTATATAARQGGRWQPTLWICMNFEPPRTRNQFSKVY